MPISKDPDMDWAIELSLQQSQQTNVTTNRRPERSSVSAGSQGPDSTGSQGPDSTGSQGPDSTGSQGPPSAPNYESVDISHTSYQTSDPSGVDSNLDYLDHMSGSTERPSDTR